MHIRQLSFRHAAFVAALTDVGGDHLASPSTQPFWPLDPWGMFKSFVKLSSATILKLSIYLLSVGQFDSSEVRVFV